MAYIHQGWVIAEPINENNADDILKIGIKRGGVWEVLFVACKLCPRYTTHTQAMIGDWHITDELVIYCPDCKEII